MPNGTFEIFMYESKKKIVYVLKDFHVISRECSNRFSHYYNIKV